MSSRPEPVDEGHADAPSRSFATYGHCDLGNVVLGHAPFEHMDGLEVDIGNRFEILRRGVASFFEIRWKRLALHAPNVIQGGLNVQPAESPSTSCQTDSS